MRNPILLTSVSLATLSLASLAHAESYYVSPDGSGSACTRAEPCALDTGAQSALAGDTVILMDGTYFTPLLPENSGTEKAWITFQADECALPIIEGPGEAMVEDENGQLPSGVASNTGTYLRFVGIVSRYWSSGFTNGWTGEGTTNSNGHFEYINCIGEGNGRTGLVLYSAPSVLIRECISAHNGGSATDSWSSGIQLYGVQGTPDENIVERNVSFENTDAQKRNDGSGFIVDEYCTGATFVNNIAFGNGGSCIRLTRSDNTRMINNSCYFNGRNPNANSPTNPGEIYWTEAQSRETSSLLNTLAAASGSSQDPRALMNPPSSGLSNNLTSDSGDPPFFTDPDGLNPDFRPPASAAGSVENRGSSNGAPETDIGFDPKCVIRADPNVPYQQSWWTHSIDYDYIRSIGGVAKCFHPKTRTGGPDIGAYEMSGPAHTFSQPGSCVASTGGAGGSTGGTNSGATGGASPMPTCQAPLEQCGTDCVDTSSDVANCGTCGLLCQGTQVCSDGVCTTVCAAGLTQCGQDCVDLMTSLVSCGSCGTSCAQGQTCENGTCVGDPTGGSVTEPIEPAPATQAIPPAAGGSGCGCRVPPRRGSTSAGLLAGLLALGLLAVRRARR
jgi:parallel beta-helix repeat protein